MKINEKMAKVWDAIKNSKQEISTILTEMYTPHRALLIYELGKIIGSLWWLHTKTIERKWNNKKAKKV